MIKLQSFWVNSVRILLTAFICTLLFISSVSPVSANTSRLDQGTAKLNDIQKRTDALTKSTDDIAKNDRSVPPSLKQTQAGAEEGGLNEIQGAADKDKMISPEDAKDTTTIRDRIEDTLSKVTNSK